MLRSSERILRASKSIVVFCLADSFKISRRLFYWLAVGTPIGHNENSLFLPARVRDSFSLLAAYLNTAACDIRITMCSEAEIAIHQIVCYETIFLGFSDDKETFWYLMRNHQTGSSEL